MSLNLIILSCNSALIMLVLFYYEKYIFNIKNKTIRNAPGFPQLSDNRSIKFNSIDSMLDKFRCIRSRKLSTLFWFSPWLLLLSSLYIYYEHDYDILASLWLITYASCAFIFNYLISTIPKALAALWDRNVFETKVKQVLLETKELNKNEIQIILETDYKKFIYMFEQKLNSSWGFCLGAVFGLMGVCLDYIYYEYYMKNDPPILTVLCAFLEIESDVTERMVTLLIVIFVGVILGLATWRVIVIGWCVRLLTEWFDLDPKFGHPDGCGGLSPLGNICLLNALMIGIISSSFGLSIIAIETTWLRWYYDFLLNYLISILSISFAISIVAFLWPVWNVHEIMKNKKYKILKKLNSIGREIEKEQRNMFEDDVVINPDILKLKITKLETLKKAYEINSQLREWPFDSNTVKTFLSSIIIPIMSLTGLGEWLINIVHELLL